MKVEIKVPEVGESITEGLLATWSVADGSAVSEGQALFELETDKTTIDVTAPTKGQLNISVAEGNDVTIGQVVGYIDTEAVASGKKNPPTPEENNTAVPLEAEEKRITPAAKSVASKAGIDPESLSGSGRGGTVTKADVPNKAKSEQKKSLSPAQNTPIQKGSEIRKPMSRIRKVIATNLTRTRDELVLLTTFNEADLSGIKTLRKNYGENFQKKHDVKLGFMSFFLKASAAALTQFPEVNAYIDSERDEVVYKNGIHISVAVSTPKGLVTPVVRNVESKSFADIEKEVGSFGKKAMDKTLMPGDLMGGTFTVTNGGTFGSMMSTPLPAANQSAILGMHAIQERPVARNGEIVIRPMMYLALSYDHRLIDGREAVGCLKMIKEGVEDPRRLLLEI